MRHPLGTRLRVRIQERLFRFGVCFLYAVGLERAVCHGGLYGVCFLYAVGRGGLSVTERLDGACFLYAVGLELSLYSC